MHNIKGHKGIAAVVKWAISESEEAVSGVKPESDVARTVEVSEPVVARPLKLEWIAAAIASDVITV